MSSLKTKREDSNNKVVATNLVLEERSNNEQSKHNDSTIRLGERSSSLTGHKYKEYIIAAAVFCERLKVKKYSQLFKLIVVVVERAVAGRLLRMR